MRKMLKNKNGITLIALVVTIVVLLILAGVTLKLVLDNNGIIQKSKEARSETIVADEKSKVEMAYLSAALKKLGDTVTAEELQEELDSSVGAGKTVVTTNGNGTLNVLFNATGHNYNVDEGTVEKVEIDNTKMAMFDTGENVAKKMHSLAIEGEIINNGESWGNLSINAIKRYKETPDLTKMTDANIVSWTDAYTAYEQNPSAYKSMIPEGTKLCPIYMWFEESGEEEIRDVYGNKNLTEENGDLGRKVKTGTIYWWSESNKVYLNPDCSIMFCRLPYLADISGLRELKTDNVTNMSRMFGNVNNQSLTNVDALSNWNTSNVTNMSYMFTTCSVLANIDGLANWDTSKVTDMSWMFGNDDGGAATEISDLTPIEKWNVGNVIDMNHMFLGCKIKNINSLSNWNVSKVTKMDAMFGRCKIQNLNAISNWNVSNLASVTQMFESNPITDASGINNWNITKVTDFVNMFYLCPTHPEFTKVTGTWDESGTFTPTTK